MSTEKAPQAGKRPAVGAARRLAQVALVRTLAETHQEFFDDIRTLAKTHPEFFKRRRTPTTDHPESFDRIRADRRKLGAGLRFGASNDAMTKLLGNVQLDTPWLRLFVWRNAQALVSKPKGPCPDLTLLPGKEPSAYDLMVVRQAAIKKCRAARPSVSRDLSLGKIKTAFMSLNPFDAPPEARLGQLWDDYRKEAHAYWLRQQEWFRAIGVHALRPRQLDLHVRWVIARHVDRQSLADIAAKWSDLEGDEMITTKHVSLMVRQVEALLDLAPAGRSRDGANSKAPNPARKRTSA